MINKITHKSQTFVRTNIFGISGINVHAKSFTNCHSSEILTKIHKINFKTRPKILNKAKFFFKKKSLKSNFFKNIYLDFFLKKVKIFADNNNCSFFFFQKLLIISYNLVGYSYFIGKINLKFNLFSYNLT
jgi:hypothetical protein